MKQKQNTSVGTTVLMQQAEQYSVENKTHQTEAS